MISPCSHRLKVKNRAIDTCMVLLNLISLSNSTGYSSVLRKKREEIKLEDYITERYVRNKFITRVSKR